jgi:hypothetical protein
MASKNDNSRNAMENSSGKGWSPPSGKFYPPSPGSHGGGPKQTVNGGHNAGGSTVHPSLKKSSK